MLYPWIKVLHVLAIISWMAAILYLPRLMVYHAMVPVGSPQSELFKVMERRLQKAIGTPAMIVAWLTGLYLAWDLYLFSDGWFHVKLLLVAILSGVHGLLSRQVKVFAADANTYTPKFYRIINEVPTVLMIGIVIMVIVRPF